MRKTAMRRALWAFMAVMTVCAAACAAPATLTVGNTGSSIKPAMVVLAHEKGFYRDEGLDVTIVPIANLNDGITAVQLGKLDILPLGIIPSVTFISKGADLVIYGGTIAEGSQGVTLPENAAQYRDLKAFRGKRIAVVLPETGKMIMKDLIRKAGVDVEREVQFVVLNGFQSVIETVLKGAADIGFVNSGFDIIARKRGLAVAVDLKDWAPNSVCCRQTTSRKTFEEKRDALVKFQTANLEAYKFYRECPDETVGLLTAYSGQPEDYVRHCLYDDVMVVTLDPASRRIKDFYEVMKANGDIDPNTPHGIDKAIDTSIYAEALDAMQARYPDSPIFKDLRKRFELEND